jgi:putative flippase GtrA
MATKPSKAAPKQAASPRKGGEAAVGVFVRFVLVGALNALIGLVVIYAFLWGGLTTFWANLVSYLILIPLSYFAHAHVSFGYRGPQIAASLRYVSAIILAYLANVTVLYCAKSLVGVSDYLAQLPALATYASTFLLLNRLYVFRHDSGAAPQLVDEVRLADQRIPRL